MKPWIWVIIIIVIIVIVIIVYVTLSPHAYRIASVYTDSYNMGRNYLDVKDGKLVISTSGMRFSLSPNSNGTLYSIKSVDDSSKVITFADGTASGALLSLATNTGATNQSWIIQPAVTDSDPNPDILTIGTILRFIPSTDTTVYMDLLDPLLTIDAPVGLSTEKLNTDVDGTTVFNAMSQQWILVPDV